MERFLQYTCWLRHGNCVRSCFEVTALWNVMQCSLVASVCLSAWACCLDLACKWLHTRRHIPAKPYLLTHHSEKLKPNAMIVCLLFMCSDHNVCEVSDYCILSGALDVELSLRPSLSGLIWATELFVGFPLVAVSTLCKCVLWQPRFA